MKIKTQRGLLSMILMTAALQLISPSTHAADCAKANSCTVAPQQDNEGSSMSTVNQAGPANRAAQSGAVKNNFSSSSTEKSKRTFTHSASVTCAKGKQEMHLSSKTATCPSGFKKK